MNLIGDGITDNTAALQAMLDAGGYLFIPPGVYCFSASLIVRSDTTIQGAGRALSILKSTNGSGIQNEHLDADPANPRLDKNITFQGIGFHGNPDLEDVQALASLCGIGNLTIHDCAFAHRRKDLIVVANNMGMRIDSCEFYDWGTRRPHDGSEGTFVGGAAIFCWRPLFRSWITNNYLHDAANGGGIWLPVTNTAAPEAREAEFVICTGNQVHGVAEFGIVLSPEYSIVAHNIMADIGLVDVSGHGSEAHGRNYVYLGNVHARIDNMGTYHSNTRNAVIASNVFGEVDRRKTGSAAIVLASQPASTGTGLDPPAKVTIVENTSDEHNGIGLIDNGGGAMSEITIATNCCGPVAIGGTKKRRQKIFVRDNT